MSIVARLPSRVAICLLLASSPGIPVWAHGSGGGGGTHSGGMSSSSHPRASLSPAAPVPSANMSAATRARAAQPGAAAPVPPPGSMISPDALDSTTLPPPPATLPACESLEAANCQARVESFFTVTQGDPNVPWSPPVPTVVPPTHTPPKIAEPDLQTQLPLGSGGGTVTVNTAGGGPTLAECMQLWDKDVHMTKALWKTVCIRTMNGTDEPSEGLGLPAPKHQAQTATHTSPAHDDATGMR